MEYVAFKALETRDSCLMSPVYPARWEPTNDGRWALMAKGWGHGDAGIYAATWKEARRYGEHIYLVVPYYLDDDEADFILGTAGWRSSRATVVAGPYDAAEQMPPELAEQIAAWYRAGYRQVPDILGEAICPSDDPLRAARLLADIGLNGFTAVAILADRFLDSYRSESLQWLRILAGVLFDDSPDAAWALLWLSGRAATEPPNFSSLERLIAASDDEDRYTYAGAIVNAWSGFGELRPQLREFAHLFAGLDSFWALQAVAEHLFNDAYRTSEARAEMLDLVCECPAIVREFFNRWRDDIASRLGYGKKSNTPPEQITQIDRKVLRELLELRPWIKEFTGPVEDVLKDVEFGAVSA